MPRLTRWVLGHRALVVLFWLAVAIAGAATTRATVDALSYDFGLPGQAAYETNVRIADEFGGGGGITEPLVLVAQGDDAAAAVEKAAGAVGKAVEGTRTVTPGDAKELAAADVAVALLYPPAIPGEDPYVKAAPIATKIAKATSSDDAKVTLTGFTVLSEGGSGGDRGVLVEVLLGGLGALIVLALVFGSGLALLPLVTAAVSILGTYLCLLGLTSTVDVVFVVQYLVALIGLGVAIDYSLLVVMRWREERAKGLDNDEAVTVAMTTAGRSVLFSGVTVAVSLAALVLVPLPFLRSIGLGGLLIPLLSVATSVTLLPVLLSVAGPRLQWPRKSFTSPSSRTWRRLARGVLRHRWWTIAGCAVVLLALATPVLSLSLGSPQLTAFGTDSPAARAATAARDAGIPVGAFRPTEVVTTDAEAAADRLADVPGVAGVAAPDDDAWTSGDSRLLQVWSEDDPSTSEGSATLDRVRALDVGDVGGTPAEDADFVSAVYGKAPFVALAVVVVTFLLLARALRSLWLPVKALALNVLSIAAAYGITVWIWQDGHGSDLLFGATSSGAITIWVPVAAFAFLFGLSMDYEVFILSRMREAYDDGMSTDDAAIEGIANTGRLVTSAALILFLAFVALSTVPSVDVKILATCLALGIAIDALIVRGLLAPALVGVLGHANWTMPTWLRRLLRVPAEHR